ncbi:methyl-accepting chemotaxis protein [Pseudomonas sp. CrR14]|nr:methyl-accepting chemotaxis protein [Pseudomonas sp. CrR14]
MKTPISLSARIGLGFAAIVSLLVIITAVGIQRVGFIDSTLDDVNQNAAKVQRYAIDFRGSVHNRAIAIRDAVLVNNQSDLERHLGEVSQLQHAYSEAASAMEELFQGAHVSAQEHALLQRIKEIEEQSLEMTTALIALRRSGDIPGAQALLLNQTALAYSEWLERINALIDYEEASIKSHLAAVQATASQFRGLMMLATAIALLLSIWLSFVIIRFVNSTLGAEPADVARAIQRLAAGELQQSITTRYPNSVMGMLHTALNRLADTMAQVREAAREVTDSSTQLSYTSASNNEHIGVQTQEAEQVATAVTEMAATAGVVSGYGSQAADAAGKATREVEHGNQLVAGTTQAIGQLASSLTETTRTVEQVAAQSEQIETVIEVINSIASQTNLLALNAAIEAARAGEQGRGFAVVADEVRSLATRTQQSTQDIRKMISALQNGTDTAVETMRDSCELASHTVQQTELAQEALSRISREVSAINHMNAQIASASLQQSTVAEGVAININRIHGSTVQSARGSHQVAQASQELNRLADRLAEKVAFFDAAK